MAATKPRERNSDKLRHLGRVASLTYLCRVASGERYRGISMASTSLSKITKTVHLSTNVWKSCEECGKHFDDDEDVAVQINHYFEHDYRLLHVGSQTTRDESGALWHSTIAILGK